jgi:hypothetical protein
MITQKETQWGMESWFLVRRRWLLPLLPDELSPYTRLGLGMVVIGAWKHSNVYIDDESYGPTLEAWVAVGLRHHGNLYGLIHTVYNSNPSYIEPVNEIFKFSKIYADMEWRERDRRHELAVWKDGKLILRFACSPTFIRAPIPYSKPRPAWLIKDNEHHIADMKMTALKSSLAFTSIEIPSDSPLTHVAKSLRPIVKYSVFFQSATIEFPIPTRVRADTKLSRKEVQRGERRLINS